MISSTALAVESPFVRMKLAHGPRCSAGECHPEEPKITSLASLDFVGHPPTGSGPVGAEDQQLSAIRAVFHPTEMFMSCNLPRCYFVARPYRVARRTSQHESVRRIGKDRWWGRRDRRRVVRGQADAGEGFGRRDHPDRRGNARRPTSAPRCPRPTGWRDGAGASYRARKLLCGERDCPDAGTAAQRHRPRRAVVIAGGRPIPSIHWC